MENSFYPVPSIYEEMSKSEKEVAEFLKSKGIWWIYEQPLFVSDNKDRPRVWTPDFFLPALGVYVEVCGSPKFNYSFRKNIYKLEETTVIFVHAYKPKWKYFLLKRLKEIHERRNELIKKIQ